MAPYYYEHPRRRIYLWTGKKFSQRSVCHQMGAISVYRTVGSLDVEGTSGKEMVKEK